MAGTAIDRPKGWPSYGPVRYTEPDSVSGVVPAPAATVTVPVWLAAGHVPCAAYGSEQSVMPLRLASNPSGSWVSSVSSCCSPSERASAIVRSPLEAALVLERAALAVGANGRGLEQPPPEPSLSTVKALVGVAAALPE